MFPPLLTQIQQVKNFDSSLTLNNGKLTSYSKGLCYAIMLNITHFFILFGMEKNGWFWTTYFTCADTKSRHLKFLQLTNSAYRETNLIF